MTEAKPEEESWRHPRRPERGLPERPLVGTGGKGEAGWQIRDRSCLSISGLNEPPLQGNECKDDPAVQLERKHLLFGVYCAQTEGVWFQLHLDYVSEEPEPSQVCSWGTVL